MSWDGSPQKSILESYDTSDMVDLAGTWRFFSFCVDQNVVGFLGEFQMSEVVFALFFDKKNIISYLGPLA